MDWQKGFLYGLEHEVPWASLEQLLESIELAAGRDGFDVCSQKHLLLRVFVLRHWLGLTPNEMERVLGRHAQVRDFVGVGPEHPPPNAAVMQQFEALLIEHHLRDVVRATIPRALGSP